MARYTIKLSKSEVGDLTAIINKGKHKSQAFRSAYILLNCDKGAYAQNPSATNKEIAKFLMVGERTIDRIKKKFIEEGFDGVLQRRPSSQ